MPAQTQNVVSLKDFRRQKQVEADVRVFSDMVDSTIALNIEFAKTAVVLATIVPVTVAGVFFDLAFGRSEKPKIGLKPNDFLSLLPIQPKLLNEKGSAILARYLDTDVYDGDVISLSSYQELRVDVEDPAKKFSIYLGSMDGQGTRFSFQYTNGIIQLMRAAQVRDFTKQIERLEVPRDDGEYFFDVLNRLTKTMNLAREQQRVWQKKHMPERDLENTGHLHAVDAHEPSVPASE